MPGFVNNLKVQHCLTFATGLVECLVFAGAVFGWASLVFVLKTEGYFSSLCVNTTGVNATNVLDCSGQDEQFSLVFTIASFMFNFLTLPNGFLFDQFGTTVARLFGISLYTTGTLMVAFSTPALSNLMFPALSLLAVGDILFIMTNVQVGNLFGSHRSTIITLYNGAVDSSSALFFVIKLLHESGISFRSSFLFLSACSVIHLLRTFFLLPRDHIPYPLPDDYTYGITCGKSKTLSLEQTAANGNILKMTEETPRNNDVPVTQEKSFRECVMSRFFAWHLLWVSVMQLRHYLFIGTFNPMLQRLTEGEPSLGKHTQTHLFPLCHFGKVYGLIMALSAVFTLLQYGCFALVNGPLDGDPLYVNISLTLLCLLGFIHPLSVYLHCRSLASQQAINASSVCQMRLTLKMSILSPVTLLPLQLVCLINGVFVAVLVAICIIECFSDCSEVWLRV
uniref:solute carrier family 43 member 3-like n=1 Tax=Epinephelus lanceolatus TaxID=310571 RepID=UPI00144778F2|nr:solute carrier family 43 member 3-like [Epinephelus lanceolatus]